MKCQPNPKLHQSDAVESSSVRPVCTKTIVGCWRFFTKIKKNNYITSIIILIAIFCFYKSYVLYKDDEYLYKERIYKCLIKEKFTEQYNATYNARMFDLRTRYMFICESENNVFEVKVNRVVYHTTNINSIVYFNLSLSDVQKYKGNPFVAVYLFLAFSMIIIFFIEQYL